MIEAIFFATFDVEEGPKVHHQVPPDSIEPSSTSASVPLFSFAALSQYIVPISALSNKPLQILSPKRPRYRILCHPVTIEGERYPRNAFTFNFCLVLAEATGFHSYLPVARKLATLFRGLEEQERFLSIEIAKHGPNQGRIYAICEILLEDLNNYSECMIPIDGTTSTLNIKLFPIYPDPPPLHAWQVPLLTINIDNMVDESWDLTMRRVLPFIDGINSVKRIASLANTDLKLAIKAIRHLLYYGCMILLDIFSFAAIYAPTQSIGEIMEDATMQEECSRYISIVTSSEVTETDKKTNNPLLRDPDDRVHPMSKRAPSPDEDKGIQIPGPTLAQWYKSLQQGQSLRAWVIEHPGIHQRIDLRRFITFGIIKGFLYRVHKYAIAPELFASSTSKAKHSSTKHRNETGIEPAPARSRDDKDITDLAKFLDGTHCFDEICTEFACSERILVDRLKKLGTGRVQIICR